MIPSKNKIKWTKEKRNLLKNLWLSELGKNNHKYRINKAKKNKNQKFMMKIQQQRSKVSRRNKLLDQIAFFIKNKYKIQVLSKEIRKESNFSRT